MTRNLKALLVASMALAAFGGIAASGAAAAQFHCSVVFCRYTPELDGTSKNAHQVFIFKNKLGESGSATCSQITGEAVALSTTSESALLKNITYDKCSLWGWEEMEVRMNNCNYEFSANGSVSIVGCTTEDENKVITEKQIELVAPSASSRSVNNQDLKASPTTTSGLRLLEQSQSKQR
jgi:hypothetical protein